jgi:energy-coupling factor transport system permease protein
MKGFLEYVPGNSLLHRLNPLTKLMLSLMICASCFVSGRLTFSLAMIGLNLLLAASAGILPRGLAMLKTLLKLSVILFFLQVFFVRQGTIWLRLPLNIVITDRGVTFSLLIVLRLIGATMPLALMLSITQLSDLSGALVEKGHVPFKYAFALTTAIRFIPVFAGEMAAIMEAQTARGVEFDSPNPFKKVRLILPLCVPLLISSVQKIEDSAVSAQLRGFNLRTRQSAYKRYPFLSRDLLVLAAGAGLIVLAALL